jgi:hypothetical protein
MSLTKASFYSRTEWMKGLSGVSDKEGLGMVGLNLQRREQ